MDEHEDARSGVHENEDGAMNENIDDEFENDNNDEGHEGSLSPDMDSTLTKLASRLCAICNSLCRGEVKLEFCDENADEWTGEREHHPSLSSLRDSLDAGCPLCKELAQSFEERLDVKPEIRDAVADSWYITCSLKKEYWDSCWESRFAGLSFRFTFYNSNGQSVNAKLGGIIQMSFFPAGKLGLGPEYLEDAIGATNAKSTPNIGLAQHWFHTCLDNHDCRDEERPKVLPTRLVEVRTHVGTSSNTIARLCEVEDLSEDASYLTLSHCWGSNTPFTLRKENLDVLKRDIPVHQLPDLFKDALRMTSELGMKYIWIDCLCILQDCEEDWAYEAARMGDIYRYAVCNIAASGYKDGKTGLFKERTPLPLLHFPLFLNLVLFGDKETVGYDVRTQFKGFYVRGDDWEFCDAIRNGPLNSRGWVAQERALSPTILHFTPKQMWWECRGHTASESFPNIAFTWAATEEWNRFGPDALRPLSTKSDVRDVYQSWNNFMSFYAGTDLTVKSDRFPALNGIARAFGELTKDNLIAGFWEGDLIQSLAWAVYDVDRAKKIPRTQLAPSWSWAFLCIPHQPAYYIPEDVTSLCVCRRILSNDPGFRSDLHYTSLKKSAVRGLEITGPLRKLPVTVERLSELPELRDNLQRLHVYYDVADSSFFSAEDIAHPEHAWHWKEPTHILPVIKGRANLVECLMLDQVPGAEHSNVFRRLGVVRIVFKDVDCCDEFLGINNAIGKSKLSTAFEDSGPHDLILI